MKLWIHVSLEQKNFEVNADVFIKSYQIKKIYYKIHQGKLFLEVIASIKLYIQAANKTKSLIRQLQKEADMEKKSDKVKDE